MNFTNSLGRADILHPEVREYIEQLISKKSRGKKMNKCSKTLSGKHTFEECVFDEKRNYLPEQSHGRVTVYENVTTLAQVCKFCEIVNDKIPLKIEITKDVYEDSGKDWD